MIWLSVMAGPVRLLAFLIGLTVYRRNICTLRRQIQTKMNPQMKKAHHNSTILYHFMLLQACLSFMKHT